MKKVEGHPISYILLELGLVVYHIQFYLWRLGSYFRGNYWETKDSFTSRNKFHCLNHVLTPHSTWVLNQYLLLHRFLSPVGMNEMVVLLWKCACSDWVKTTHDSKNRCFSLYLGLETAQKDNCFFKFSEL